MLAARVAGSLALLLLAPSAPAPAQAPDPLAGFDAYVAQAVREWEVPGLAVAVVKDGRTVFARGYGVRTLGEPQPVDEHTLFSIGSTTKAMTAAAVGILVDEGKVAWDDPVTKHLPWFQLRDPAVTREVTVRDLLTHRAGLGNADFLWYEQEGTPRSIVERLRLVEPAYSLRGGFIYQNVMYAAAGEVVAAASRIPWTEFVRTRLVRPIGMERTVMLLAETRGVENVAAPHDVVAGRLRPIENASVDPVAAAGSVWSSVHDMARWLAFLQRGCVTEGGQPLLKRATCDELFRPQTVLPGEGMYPTARLVKPNWSTYGLGWFQQDYEGRKVDFHTGSIDGMIAIAGLLRAEGVGVIVLGNRDHAELRHALMYRVFDHYDGDPPRDWSTEVKALYAGLAARGDSAQKAADGRRVPNTRPTHPLARYAGTYSDPLRGTLVVSEEGGKLRVRYGRLTGLAEHWHYDTFRVQWDTAWRGGPLVQFIPGRDGTPERVEMGGAVYRREGAG